MSRQGSTEFKCPECGDFKFGGSRRKGEADLWDRMCHGYVMVPGVGEGTVKACGFQWPEEEDYKYFTVDGKSFDSPKALDEYYASLPEVVIRGRGTATPPPA